MVNIFHAIQTALHVIAEARWKTVHPATRDVPAGSPNQTAHADHGGEAGKLTFLILFSPQTGKCCAYSMTRSEHRQNLPNRP